MKYNFISNLLSLSLLPLASLAIDLDITSYESIQAATGLISSGLMDYYDGKEYGGTIGEFTNPYYWWEAGGAWGSMIDHWFFLQNDTYHDIIYQSLLYQTGDDYNYMPLNQTTTEGNDDQAFWGIAAIQAAERNFTNPPEAKEQWLYLAQAVFNTMSWRWDTDSCGGGLRWQIFQWNAGYDYKNVVANAGLFHIGARLARFTGNDSYVEWCEKVYDWLVDTNMLVEGSAETLNYWFVYDGASTGDNCTDLSKYQWTYNAGLVVSGCAYLYNYTQEEVWLNRTENYLKGVSVFFNNSIAYEAACQASGNCNNDQRSFKAYFMRFLSLTSLMAPSTYDTIRGYIEASAMGAAQSCSGGSDSHTCGTNWSADGWDGNYGLGEQMAALEVIQNLLASDRPAPYTASNGGSSYGDGAAGASAEEATDTLLSLDDGDKAGAAIITCIIGVSIVLLGLYLII